MTQPDLPLEGGREIWSVSDLVAETRWALEEAFSGVWVRGEISGLTVARTGHHYFSLKDDSAMLDVVLFRSYAQRLPFALEEGIEVLACGNLSLYEPRGRFQLVASDMEPAGWGAQQLAFEQLKRQLESEGLFDDARKRPLPLLPRCIGVVTSAQGAAWHDMRIVWQRREVPVRALLAPATVQGEGAAAQIVDAMQLVIDQGDAEVMIVGRGGGSTEDLWAFNEETVARAIAASPIPVISAVGHEVDVTIADHVADRRAATPTAAAEIVAPSRAELLERIEGSRRRIASHCDAGLARASNRLRAPVLQRALAEPARAAAAHQQRLDLAWEALEDASGAALHRVRERVRRTETALLRHDPSTSLARAEREIATLRGRLRAAAEAVVNRRSPRLAATAARTEAMSPVAVLGRGYSLCENDEGTLIRDSSQVAPGDPVRVRLARGQLRCEVTEEIPPSTGRDS